jgi:predicted nucleotidyltransferase
VGDRVRVEVDRTVDQRALANELSATYRLDFWTIAGELERIYPGGEEIPRGHVNELSRQIEQQAGCYVAREEEVEVSVALVRADPESGVPDRRGWTPALGSDGKVEYVTEITYFRDRERCLLRLNDVSANAHGLGFHYEPYNFDSRPEIDFFRRILQQANLVPEQVEDVYYTGALSDPHKTEFFVEYKGQDGRWRRYTPDFVIRTRDGRCVIVEVKREHDRGHEIDGERGRKASALAQLADLNRDRIRYHMVFTASDEVDGTDIRDVVKKLGLSASVESGARELRASPAELARFCERWGIAELALFGSFARGEARPDSDVDVLVTFAEGARTSLMKMRRIERELADLFGREVDVIDRDSLEGDENPMFRGEVLREVEPLYRA